MTIEQIQELRKKYEQLCDVSDVPEWKRKITLKFHNILGDNLDERESKTAQIMVDSFKSLPKLLCLAEAGIRLKEYVQKALSSDDWAISDDILTDAIAEYDKAVSE